MKRTFSPYERNQLKKAKIELDSLDPTDQTPVEYLTGFVEFRGLKFSVSPATLIPRVETEELVTLALKEINNLSNQDPSLQTAITIADVGTGSGVIALSLADALLKRQQSFSLIASDTSSAALQLAKQNQSRLISRQNLDHNQATLEFIKSDLLSNFPPVKFKLMVANLPYIPSSRINQLDESVKNFEPHQALDGGKDGLVIIKKFLKQAPSFLAPNGVILLETDHTHNKTAFAPLKKQWQVKLLTDSFNRQRFARLTKK